MRKNNYLIKGLMSLLLFSAAGWANAQTYCASAANNAADSKIDRVVLTGNSSTLDQMTGPTSCETYTDYSNLPAVTLSAGSEYTLSIYHGTCDGAFGSTQFAKSSLAWIDYNNDGTFDASEALSTTYGYSAFGVAGYVNDITFTVPCNISAGNVRLRISLREQNAAPLPCGNFGWGEVEDYTVNLVSSTSVAADFSAPTTAFVGTVVNFNNAFSGYISYEWTIDGTTYNTQNATHLFATTGTFDVKLKNTNCFGSDSITKQVTVIAPTAPPASNFISNKNVVELFENIQFTDLSSNGPTFWDWTIYNDQDTIDGDDQFSLRGGDPFVHKNPSVFTGNFATALGEGVWTVRLLASNNVPGSVPEVKIGYITVQRSSYNMGAETVLPAGIITTTSGALFDKGGANGNYPAGETNEALIAPCGAQSVTLNFSQFAFNTNAELRVYDGDGITTLGNLLTTFNSTNPGTTITSNTGRMYLLMISTAGASDAGFAANWTSVIGTGAAPIADFTIPGPVLYNAVPVSFNNTSLNAGGSTTFEWTLSGPIGTQSFNTRDLNNLTFLTNGSYTLTLTATTCDGQQDSKSQSFVVESPTTPTELDFSANNQRPSVGESVTLTATSDKANNFEWEIFPAIGWTPDAPINNTLNVRSFTFNAPGVYTVVCRAFNSTNEAASEATVVKTSYILVVENCTPIIGLTTSSDVGISYVGITDPITGTTIENSSASGTGTTSLGYSDFSDLGAIELNFGGTYTIEVRRPSNVNPMSRKIWIDWNVDGDFDDAGEEVGAELTDNTLSWTATVVVPDAATAFEANTTARIGVSYDTDPNEPCGASTNPNANRIGEFEDYLIRVVNDGDAPVITLNGDDTIFIEQNAAIAYVSDSATAMDPSQGDVTDNIVISSDLDQTLAGIYYEEYNVMDASGNPAETVVRVIYVVADQTAPVITVNAAADTTIEVGTPWVDLGATATDNKDNSDDLTNAIITSGMVDENLLGDYIITYSVRDNQGNAASTQRTVRVRDTQVPIIDNANADKSGACWTVEVQLRNIFADVTSVADNYNNLGDGLTFTANPASSQGGAAVDTRFQGTTSVTYTATDESGNVTTQCIDYVVRDYIAPTIDLRTLDVINHPVNTPYTPVSATASDNLYTSTQISLSQTSNVDAYTLGTYQDTYTAIDAAGNTATKVRTVNVIDDVSPIVRGKLGGILRVGVGSAVDALDYITFTDNYDEPSILLANHRLISNDINLQEAGIYSAVFVTEDNSGNMSNEYILYVDVQYNYEVVTGSVNDISLDNLLSVFPNPTNGEVNINVNLPENEVINLAIFNTMGQQVALVQNGKAQNGTFNVSLANQANGIYYVKMNVQDKIITKRIVLNK